MAPWTVWALGAAFFATLTAILAKVGVEGVPPGVATFVRTVVVVIALGGLLVATGQLSGCRFSRAAARSS